MFEAMLHSNKWTGPLEEYVAKLPVPVHIVRQNGQCIILFTSSVMPHFRPMLYDITSTVYSVHDVPIYVCVSTPLVFSSLHDVALLFVCQHRCSSPRTMTSPFCLRVNTVALLLALLAIAAFLASTWRTQFGPCLRLRCNRGTPPYRCNRGTPPH
jgi:hypothetical protein